MAGDDPGMAEGGSMSTADRERIEGLRRQRQEWKSELEKWRLLQRTARERILWLEYSLYELGEVREEASDDADH